MIFGILEMFRNEPLLLFLITIGVASAIGGIPPIIERQRRRGIENDLPAMLEALSDSLGAGLGLQQAMMAEADRNTGTLGRLLKETLSESHASSFDSALANFATKSRSSQVQRVMHLISTALEQDAPLQKILADMSRDYERLNDLMNRRESELMGRAILIIMFVSIGLPFLIAFIVGLFAPRSQGFQLDELNSSFTMFFGAASLVAIGVSGRMLGRMRSALWWAPLWMSISMTIYHVGVLVIGG
ncbi:MAG: type II secretion system F family protein [Candidatus Poseidoniales archaeon]|jgi:pilus assembly protein TadC|tara:strand:+ start:362 stop:1093 length:732 start_codon:yes stop_codon:yes gene_type:complete